jgi:uncharacterized protein (TIGR03083 family)
VTAPRTLDGLEATMRNVEDITPITRATDAREVARRAYEQLIALLDDLEPDDWSTTTECAPWTVADMVGHLIGATKANSSIRELLRQQVWAMRHKGEFDGNDLDAMNELQIREHRDLTPDARIVALRSQAPKAVEGRMRFPGPLRMIGVPLAQGGSTADGMPKSLRMGHLMDVIYTRDAWLHRVDIARATGRDAAANSEADSRVVEDLVAEWAPRHGKPFTLTLVGPAGGAFRQGTGGPDLELDAVEFCRTLSGRVAGEGLLATRVLF